MINPTCCERDARFVNNGRTLQYFYCDECKKEVEHPDPLVYVQTLSDEDADDFFERLQRTQLIEPPQDKHPISNFQQIREEIRQQMVHEPILEREYKQHLIEEINKSYAFSDEELNNVLNSSYLPPATVVSRSVIVDPGTYLLSWVGGELLLSKCTEPVEMEALNHNHAYNWATVSDRGYFEGTSINDVHFVKEDFIIPTGQTIDNGPKLNVKSYGLRFSIPNTPENNEIIDSIRYGQLHQDLETHQALINCIFDEGGKIEKRKGFSSPEQEKLYYSKVDEYTEFPDNTECFHGVAMEKLEPGDRVTIDFNGKVRKIIK